MLASDTNSSKWFDMNQQHYRGGMISMNYFNFQIVILRCRSFYYEPKVQLQ